MVKNLPTNAGDVDSVPAWGRPPGGGNSNPLQYSCLGNPMDRGAWQATVRGVSKSQTRLSRHTRYFWGLLSLPPSNIWIPNMIYNRYLVTSVPSLSSVTSPPNSTYEQRGKSLRCDSVVEPAMNFLSTLHYPCSLLHWDTKHFTCIPGERGAFKRPEEEEECISSSAQGFHWLY